MDRTLGALLAVVAMAFGVSPACGLELGGAAGPVNLVALSGERIVMNNYAERPATAVLFLSGRCDVTLRAIADINQLYEKHRRRDVLFVGVCSNTAESQDELRTFAQRRGIIFPIYRDPVGDVARQFGARSTPELFLLDRWGRLVYHGGLHDAAARQDLAGAVGNLLRKQPIDPSSRPVEGTLLDSPGPKREIDDPYGTISFSSELVFERIPFVPAHHCSTICEAAQDELLCLWYGGSYESADDQVLFLSRKKPGEKNWSPPRVLVQNTAQPPGNGVIFRDANNRVWIVWTRMEGTRPMRRGSGWDRCRLMVRSSTDQGQTWSEDRPLLEETLWCVPRNPPIALADGSLLLPVEGSLNEVEGSHFLTLAPGASAWKRAGFTRGGSQPAVIERSDRSLVALMRHAPFITQIESRDGGQTWSQAVPTKLKNPDAGITMTKLANGHLVLVFNDSQTGRTPLCISRSLDEGKTWEKPLHLESNPGEYSYPSIIQSSTGKVHITYTFRRYAIKHVELNEDWVVHFERPD
jgi:predicted neuraminidase/peroxiredoxin